MRKATSRSEIIFIIILALGFLVPPIIFAQWWLLGVFVAFFMCFGVIEVVSKKKSGKTVSQHFWALKDRNKVGAWIIAVSMLIAWLALLWHFLG